MPSWISDYINYFDPCDMWSPPKVTQMPTKIQRKLLQQIFYAKYFPKIDFSSFNKIFIKILHFQNLTQTVERQEKLF